MGEKWLSDLFEKQNELDNFIDNYRDYTGSLDEKYNALMVEIGEFLNELRIFKYWSDKEPDFENAFEEYTDGLHFLLSIGNTLWAGMDHSLLQKRLDELNNTDLELDLEDNESKMFFVSKSNNLFKTSEGLFGIYEDYVDYFIHYIKIGFYIGMDINTICKEYIKKNDTNYERQLSGY